MNSEKKTRFLLSFLMILVVRAGGIMKIDNLDEFGGRVFDLRMVMDKDNKSVVLKAFEMKAPTIQ